ncbi:LbtU family siderophore porin [Candidatus Dependentiae bacterium]|nr:LbtU family siderophore porin [Candidatus Dependentiae bacterium]
MLKKVLLSSMILCLLFSSSLFADNAVKMPELKFSGLLEVDLFYQNNENAADRSDVEVTDAQLNIDAKVNDKINGNIVIYWDNSYGAQGVDIDEAKIDWTVNDKINLRAGKFYLPFGNGLTNLITDPATLGYTSQWGSLNGIEMDYKAMNELVLKAAIFNAQVQLNDQSNDYFRDIVLAGEYSKNNLTLSLSMITNIAELYNQSAAGTFATATTRNRGIGLDLYLNYKINKLSLTGEYLDSVRKPKTDIAAVITEYDIDSYNLEAGYEYSEKLNFGARCEYSKVKSNAANLSKIKNYAVGANYNVYTNTILKFEYLLSKNDLTKLDTNTFTTRVSYSF